MDDSRHVLIVGADGLIGTALTHVYRASGAEPLLTSRRAGRLATPTSHLDLAELTPGWLPPPGIGTAFLCAAVTSQAECERDPARTQRINVENTVALARTCVAAGAFVIFLSTSTVFDGSRPFSRPDDPLAPKGEYARQKAEGEARILALGAAAAVVRVTKVLGPGAPLIRAWIDDLRRNREIFPFDDMVFAPLDIRFVAEKLAMIATRRLSGITQLSASRDISYADAARHIASRLPVPAELVVPTTAASAGIPAPFLHAHTTLDTTRMQCDLGSLPPEPFSVLDNLFDLKRAQ